MTPPCLSTRRLGFSLCDRGQVTANGAMCSQCRWADRHCLGCGIACDATPLRLRHLDTISLDWDLDYFDAFEEGNAVRHEGVWETSPKAAADSTRGF